MPKKKPKYHVRPDGLHETIRRINGKRIAFRGKSDAEVERKMIEYQARMAQGRPFSAVADDWEREHFESVAPNTLRAYRPALTRAVDHFGDDLIREITPPDIKKFIVDFAAKGYAKKTVTTQLQICNMIFSFAVERGECDTNPCTCVSIPKGLRKTYRDAATPEDEQRIKATPHIWLLPFFILYTGVRKGEALAIQGRDIDRKQMVIHVTKSVYHDSGGRPHIKPPKSKAGVRDVPLLAPLLPHLPKVLGTDKYLFSLDRGATPLTESEYARLWKNYVLSTGISCSAHQLRHSYATLLFETDGVELKDAQTILGHSTAAMTQDVYTHIRDTRQKRTAQLLNAKLKKNVSNSDT